MIVKLKKLKNHPFKNNSDSYLWIGVSTNPNQKNKPLGKAGLSQRIRLLVKKAGINKKVNPHSWRHARATELANYLTEPQMCKYFGWQIGSKMPSVYVHLTSRDVDDTILTMHGLNKEKSNDKMLSLIECPRCHQMINTANKFCSKCGLLLDEQESMKGHMVNNQFVSEEMFELLVKEVMKRVKFT